MTTIPPHGPGFAGAPVYTDPARLPAGFAYLGIPYGIPYGMHDVHPPSATAPAAVRRVAEQFIGELHHYDFDIGGPVFEEGDLRLSDAGDVPGDPYDVPETAAADRHNRVTRKMLRRLRPAHVTSSNVAGECDRHVPGRVRVDEDVNVEAVPSLRARVEQRQYG